MVRYLVWHCCACEVIWSVIDRSTYRSGIKVMDRLKSIIQVFPKFNWAGTFEGKHIFMTFDLLGYIFIWSVILRITPSEFISCMIF